jgi:outer membrane autotransporter protein
MKPQSSSSCRTRFLLNPVSRSACALVGLLAPAVILTGQVIVPAEEEHVVIDTPDSPAVRGADGVGGVKVEVKAAGVIATEGTPAVLGQGPGWSVTNAGTLKQAGEGAAVQLSEGTVTNTGRIEVTGRADGMEGVVLLDGSRISNNSPGVITVTNEQAGGAATGIRVRLEPEAAAPEDPDGEDPPAAPPVRRTQLTNSGTLRVQVAEQGVAVGVTSEGNLTLTNGSILEVIAVAVPAQPEADESAEPVEPGAPAATAVAIRVSEGDGNITNSGTIRVTGTAEQMDGIVLQDGGVITNRGRIEITNQHEGGSATGITIRRDAQDETSVAQVVNTGTISVADGLAVNLVDGGSLRNTGRIVGDVFLGSGDSRLTITPGQEIEGSVDAGGGNNILELIGPSATAGIYDGSFSGFTELQVNASPTTGWQMLDGEWVPPGTPTLWRLTGGQEYSGGTDVKEGWLHVVDPLVSDVRIQEKGRLIATGLITGDVDVGGSLTAGELDARRALVSGDGEGLLSVDGGLIFREGGGLVVITGQTRLQASGSVAIGVPSSVSEEEETGQTAEDTSGPAATRLTLINSSASWGESGVILRSEGGVTGEFDAVTVSGSRPFLDSEIGYTGNEVTYRIHTNREALEGAAETRNQRSVARVLGGLNPESGTPLEARYIELLNVANEENFGQLADTLNGEILASGAVAAASFSGSFRQTVVNTIQYRPDRPQPMVIYQPAPQGGLVPVAEEEAGRGLGLWTRAFGIAGEVERSREGANVDYSVGGLIVGSDMLVTGDSRAGVAVGYGRSKVERARERVTGDVYQAALYATHRGNAFIYDGTLGFGHHELESRRLLQPSGDRYQSDYSANDLSASLQATLVLDDDGFLILPFGGVDFSHFRQGAFRERGPEEAFGLNVASTDMNLLRAFLGVRVMLAYSTANYGLVTPEIRIRYGRELLGENGEFVSGFQGDPDSRFVTTSSPFDRNRFDYGGGVMIQPGRWQNVSIFFDYDGSLSSSQAEHLASAGVRIGF